MLKEKYEEEIQKDKPASYRFRYECNPVRSINITSNVDAGLINAAVEVLKDKSSFVKETAPGVVYKNFNVWVGTSGFGTSKFIQAGVIRFRIENSWLDTNGFSGSDIRLVKWNGSKWIELETTETGKDANFNYFEATTHSFSPFAITVNHLSFTFKTTNNIINITVDGIPYMSPYKVSWIDGTNHTVGVLSTPVNLSNRSHYNFISWSGKRTSNSTFISLTSNASTAGIYTANYTIIKMYSLTINLKGIELNSKEVIDVDPQEISDIGGDKWYDSGTNVTLLANATVNYSGTSWEFLMWEYSNRTYSNPTTLNMTKDYLVTAHYWKPDFISRLLYTSSEIPKKIIKTYDAVVSFFRGVLRL